MQNSTKFFLCKHCKNLVGMIHDSNVPIICCGEEMTLLEANTTEASTEKHIPVIEKNGNKIKVTVGQVIHPMLEEHNISWIYLLTEKGGQRQNCTDKPVAEFLISDDDKPIAAYAYCNLHGLWKKEF